MMLGRFGRAGWWTRVLCAVCAALLLVLAPAFAQESRWTSPDGTYTLSTAGWRVLPDLSDAEGVSWEYANNPQELLLMCTANRRLIPVVGAPSQAAANALLQSPPRSITATDFSVRDVDGIAVQSFTLTDEGRVSYYRRFLLAGSNSVVGSDIACGGDPSASAEHRAAFTAFLESLQFMHPNESVGK